MMNSEEILEELAAQTDEIREFSGATFELSEDYWAICDTRLSAFASEEMWVIAVEVVGYNYGADTHSLHIHLFGNCVQEREEFYLPDFARDLLTVPAAWNQRTEKIEWGIARDGFAVEWGGKRFDFAPNFIEFENVKMRIFRDLLPEVEAMIAELQAPFPRSPNA